MKTLIIVQARMNSTRLPGKVLEDASHALGSVYKTGLLMYNVHWKYLIQKNPTYLLQEGVRLSLYIMRLLKV